MSTPTDPYNSGTTEPFKAEDTLQPIDAHTTDDAQGGADSPETPATFGEDSPATPYEDHKVAYGDSDALAWESAFEQQDSLANPKLDDLSFDDDIPSSEPGVAHESAPADQTAINEARSAHLLTNSEPLEEGATFASAYSATGVTELPAQPLANDTEIVLANEPEVPVRESVFAAPTAAPAVNEASRLDWNSEPTTPLLADLPDEPKGRAWAHIGSIFATLLLVPITWYLISDAGARLNLVENSPWNTGHVNIPALIEFVGGLLSIYVLWLMARASSLGAQLWGIVLTIAGLAAIVAPRLGTYLIGELDREIADVNAFTGNVVHHLNLDLGSGRIAVFGFVLFLTGIMIHLGRKSSERRAVAKTVREQVLGSN